MADYLLRDGLVEASLQSLTAAANINDRMLLYHLPTQGHSVLP